MISSAGPKLDYICPACREPVMRNGQSYHCSACRRTYPIFFEIPDFRLSPDRYLSLEEERVKAIRLEAFSREVNFMALVDHYYAITEDVPAALRRVFAGYVRAAPARAALSLERLGGDPATGRLLDLGCGSGGALLCGGPRYADCTGVDIALRWLVIARKRLAEAGASARLVCADAEALPFANGAFTHILADDLIENVRSPEAAIRGAAAVLEPGGRLWISAANRRWIGPHPATGVWAAGFQPRKFQAALLHRRYGFDLLRAVSMVSPTDVRRGAAQAHLKLREARPRSINVGIKTGRSASFRILSHIYMAAARLPGARALLTVAGPAFEMLFTKHFYGTNEI